MEKYKGSEIGGVFANEIFDNPIILKFKHGGLTFTIMSTREKSM
jgi:hypothetical protein